MPVFYSWVVWCTRLPHVLLSVQSHALPVFRRNATRNCFHIFILVLEFERLFGNSFLCTIPLL